MSSISLISREIKPFMTEFLGDIHHICCISCLHDFIHNLERPQMEPTSQRRNENVAQVYMVKWREGEGTRSQNLNRIWPWLLCNQGIIALGSRCCGVQGGVWGGGAFLNGVTGQRCVCVFVIGRICAVLLFGDHRSKIPSVHTNGKYCSVCADASPSAVSLLLCNVFVLFWNIGLFSFIHHLWISLIWMSSPSVWYIILDD